MSGMTKEPTAQELTAMWNLLKAAISDLPQDRYNNVLVGIANYAEAYAKAESATLRAEIERLEKDAGRYRWLRSQVRWELPNQRDSWTTPSGVYLVATMVSKVYGDCDEQTDAAIDAAKGASHEP